MSLRELLEIIKRVQELEQIPEDQRTDTQKFVLCHLLSTEIKTEEPHDD